MMNISNLTKPNAAENPFEEWVDVTAHLVPELDIVAFSFEDTLQLMRTDATDAIRAALADSEGAAQWCAKYSRLLIPSSHRGAGNRFFTLAEVDAVAPQQNDDGDAHRAPDDSRAA